MWGLGRPLRRPNLLSREKQTPWNPGATSLHSAPAGLPACASLPPAAAAARGAGARIACLLPGNLRPLPPNTYTPRRAQRQECTLMKEAGIKAGKRAKKKKQQSGGEKETEKKRNTTHAGEARGSMQICSLQTANH